MLIIEKIKEYLMNFFNRRKKKEYWVNKWSKGTVKYKAQNNLFRDIRTLINYPSWIADEVLYKIGIRQNSTDDEKLKQIIKWVNNSIKYRKDIEEWKSSEFWADSDIIFQKQLDDCDGYAIALKTLTLAANIPDWKVKVVAGYTRLNRGHAYCIFLNNKNHWVTADACWSNKLGTMPHKNNKKYGIIWFTFTKNYTFSESNKTIKLN